MSKIIQFAREGVFGLSVAAICGVSTGALCVLAAAIVLIVVILRMNPTFARIIWDTVSQRLELMFLKDSRRGD